MDLEQAPKPIPKDGEIPLQQPAPHLPVTPDNDEVQFMYSAPKSKRKRKRSASTTTSLHNPAPSETPQTDQVPPFLLKPDPGQRRASAGMVQQFESCHIGPKDDQAAPNRTDSLPTIGLLTNEEEPQHHVPNDVQATTTCKDPTCPEPSEPTLTALWQDPPCEPPPRAPSPRWEPISFSPVHSAKVPKVSSHTRTPTIPAIPSQPPQVSPKTVPQSVTLPVRDTATPSYLEMLEGANMQDMLSLTIPSISCPENNDEVSGGFDTRYRRLQHGLRDTSPDLPTLDSVAQSTEQPQGVHTSRNIPFQQNPRRATQAGTSRSSPYTEQTAYEKSISPYYPGAFPRMFRQEVPPLPPPHIFNQPSTHRTSQAGTNNFFAPYMTPISDDGSFFRQAPLQRPPQYQTHSRSPPSPQPTQRADLLRRPSLYKIPPWSAQSCTPLPTFPQPQRQPTGYYEIAENYDLRRSDYDPRTEGPPSHGGSRVIHDLQDKQPVSSETGNQGARRGPAAEPPYPSPQPEQPPPRKRARRREFSPNLIVDIAETLSALLPIEELARRHNKTPQKVHDAFAAVVQIPLLRNAQDGRRHGELAKRRMREYRDARKAMERERSGR